MKARPKGLAPPKQSQLTKALQAICDRLYRLSAPKDPKKTRKYDSSLSVKGLQ